jgi:branched-chain amino acid transport system permease protein
MIKQILKFLVFLIVLAVVPLLLPGGRLGAYYLTLLILAASYAVAALGLTVLLGYSGQISLAQAAFFGIGAYAFSILAVRYGVPFWPAAVAAVAVAAAFGLVLGMISLRLASHYLALVTIGFQIITQLVLANWHGLTGGPDGISNIPRPSLFGLTLSTDEQFYWVALGILGLAAYVVARLRQSRLGGALLALREDEIAAAAYGVSIFRTKVMAFAIAAALGGLGGVIYASGSLYISPDVFNFYQSVSFFAMVLVGGRESIVGSILGAGLLTFLPELLRFLQAYTVAIYGLLVVVVVLFLPQGLYGALLSGIGMLRARREPAPETAGVVAAGAGRPVATAEVLLEIKGLTKRFGGVTAVNGLDITVCKGDVAVLIGPNGSGKTTVLNVLSGIYSANGGGIFYRGAEVTNAGPNQVHALGISRTFQNIRLFPELTALENVVVGYYSKGTVGLAGTLLSFPRGYREEREAVEKARATLHELGFTRLDVKAKSLPYGQQRIVEIARAIVAGPDLLLLDEPAAGMNHEETAALSDILYRIHALGLTMLLIEHDMTFVASVATRAYVMDFGQKIGEGSVQEVLSDPAVIAAYLGDETEYA